ncbi:helix-turn-helix domain-containing protein [bacterium]|nr:helix-turn-helix domain-containing protein [bacterium]
MKNKFGEKIKEIRTKTGLNQDEFAKELGYTSRSTINKIEKGVNVMSHDKLELLIRKFDVEVNDLFDSIAINTGGSIIDEQEIKNIKVPDPDFLYPKAGVYNMKNIKPLITRKNIIVGNYSYYSGKDFESRVTHHYDFLGDKLIVGKFCQIGNNVEFIMNGANHQLNAATTFPFYVMDGWKEDVPKITDMPYKGDTVVGNDCWIGQNVTILPGVHIGNGVIIGANSVVTKDLPSYSICAGNPCAIKKMRFDDDIIKILEELKWWDKSVDEIQKIIPIITKANPSKEELIKLLN